MSVKTLEKLQTEIESGPGWNIENCIEKIAEFKPSIKFKIRPIIRWMEKTCRVREAIISEPEVLLLDEPTNHLDIETIEWFEKSLIILRAA